MKRKSSSPPSKRTLSALSKQRRPLLEELEPRLLFSANIDGALFGHSLLDEQSPATPAIEMTVADTGTGQAATKQDPAAQAATNARCEIVFVDSGVPDHQRLVNDLLTGRDDKREIKIVMLDSHRDGLEQISETLRDKRNIAAIHIISHGKPGALELGNATIDLQAIEERAGQLEARRASLTPEADILLYGCDVAQPAEGRMLVTALSQLTGADVTASDDLTGNAGQGR
jgi:hypothetical protein